MVHATNLQKVLTDVRTVSAEEVDEILDRLVLNHADQSIRSFIQKYEELRLLLESLRQKVQKFCAAIRIVRNTRDVIQNTAVVTAELSMREKISRKHISGSRREVRLFRRGAEKKSAEFRAKIIPICDRYEQLAVDLIAFYRDAFCICKALMYEKILDLGQLSPEAEIVAEGEVNVAAVKDCEHSVIGITGGKLKRKYRYELKKLAFNPRNPSLHLTPVGAASSTWAACLSESEAILLRCEPGEEKDLLIVLDILPFRPIAGKIDLTGLADGAAFICKDGRLMISADSSAAPPPEDLFAQIPESGLAAEMIGGTVGKEYFGQA
ncbi:MAG: hypothetical protein GY862_37260 [Gammaproteobacteria bacterium]|nr:hypothetical protein [Gammaproteobacteria bacterium]